MDNIYFRKIAVEINLNSFFWGGNFDFVLEILKFLHGAMFAAWNEKPKKPNMSQQNVISLPSIGYFVGDLAQRRQKKVKM